MLDVAETLDPLLDARARRVEQAELGLEDEDIDEYMAETTLQLIFFDGEEAFVDWTATDSIYGARSGSLSSFPSSAHPFPIFFPTADTSPQRGRRRTYPHTQSAASSPPQHRQLHSQQSSTWSSLTSSAHHTRSCAPTSPKQPGCSTSLSAPRRASATQASSTPLRSAIAFSTHARRGILVWHIWAMITSHFYIVA